MTKRMVLCAVAVILAGAGAGRAAEEEKAPPHKTDWMYNARWGVMYLFSSGQRPGSIKTKEDWDKVVREFDAKGLAKQLHDLGAGYMIITSYHYGHGVAPTKDIDGGKFPSRDLIADLANELAKCDIRLMLYYPTGMGISEEHAKQTANRMEELSKRYGKKISGWWLDNSIPGETKRQEMIAEAARSGNPDALVGMSKGESPFDDYTANNEHAPGSAVCRGRFTMKRQWHMLTFLGHNWGGLTKHKGNPRFDANKAAWITAKVVAGGGAVTWDVPWEMNGLLAKECMPVLQAIAKAAREAKRETREALGLPKKHPPHKTDWLFNARWGIFYHYLPHVREDKAFEAAVKSFDVPGLVTTLKDVKAGYFMLSARNAESQFPVAPLSSYRGGKFPSRDLVGEVADALAKEKIPLIAYYATRDTAGAPAGLRELSLRYGKRVSAWYIEAGKDYKALATAARAGNPAALLTLSSGWAGVGSHPHVRNSEYDDFTQGRTPSPRAMSCPKRFVSGLQWHTLGTFGFSKYQRRYEPPAAREITSKHLIAGGVITWNTPHTHSGKIAPEWLPSVQAAGKAATELVRNVPPPDPGLNIKNPTPPKPPAGAVATTCAHTMARAISAKQDWWNERQQELGLLVGVGKRHAHFVRSLLVFDLKKIDKTRPVVLAVLHLHARNGPVGEPTEQCNHVEIHRFTQQVSDLGHRWYLHHYAGEGGKLWKITKAGPIEVDVTEIVRAWTSGQPNYGLRLSAPGLGAEWQRYGVTWRSFEAGLYDPKTNPKGPRLIIYQMPADK